MGIGLEQYVVPADNDSGQDREEERLLGTQLKFAADTIRALRSGRRQRQTTTRPLFGNQIRFAVATIREGVERRRGDHRSSGAVSP